MFQPSLTPRQFPISTLCLLSWIYLFQGMVVSAGEEQCGRSLQGRPVPEMRAEMAPGEILWPRTSSGEVAFRPASNSNGVPLPIPAIRDSTSYIGFGVPGQVFGHELFTDVARLDGNDDWLFGSYNAGLQVWDLRANPANPNLVAFREGWLGHFQEFPLFGKADTYVEAIDVVQSGGQILIGLVGRSGHGFSFWEFVEGEIPTQHCQVSTHVARQIELIEHKGRPYAFVSASDGLYVYDLISSQEGSCALEGKVGTMADGNYVSVLQKNGAVFVAAADGSFLASDPLAVEIWQVDPEDPASARRLFEGFDTNSRGVTLFSIPGASARYFLGLIETSSAIKFYDVEACLEHMGPGDCGGLGSPLATQEILDIGKLYEFLDISESSDGRVWGYYGFMTSPGLFGSKFEYLLDLTPLASITAREAEISGPLLLSEITDGGGTYNNSSPCENQASVDYWGDYYPKNRYGLNILTPRHGIFIKDKFYRAAYSMLDVHEIVNSPPAQGVSTTIQGGRSSLWLDEVATYTGNPEGVCAPEAGNWCWVVETAGDDVADMWSHAPDLGSCNSSYSNPEAFDYSCAPGAGKSRCANGSAVVTAWNTSCGPFPPSSPQTTAVIIELKDPIVDIEGTLDTGGTVYQQCQEVGMTAALGGRGPISWQWSIDGEPLEGCSGITGPGTDLATINPRCVWDTKTAPVTQIFADGFESGDTQRWSEAVAKRFSTSLWVLPSADSADTNRIMGGQASVDVQVALRISDGGELDFEPTTITVEEIGSPSFKTPGDEISIVVVDRTARITAQALDTSRWTWEIEDPDAGTSVCSFDGTATCVIVETSSDTVEYMWSSDGAYDFVVTLSNCRSPDSQSASGSVSVSMAVQPNISTFRFNPASATQFCCGSPFAGFECQSGVEIELEVELVQEDPSYGFSFDWERTSQASANFQPQAPAGQAGGNYRFTHTFSSTGSARTIFPVAKVTSGPLFDVEDFYTSDDSIVVLAAGETCD